MNSWVNLRRLWILILIFMGHKSKDRSINQKQVKVKFGQIPLSPAIALNYLEVIPTRTAILKNSMKTIWISLAVQSTFKICWNSNIIKKLLRKDKVKTWRAPGKQGKSISKLERSPFRNKSSIKFIINWLNLSLVIVCQTSKQR